MVRTSIHRLGKLLLSRGAGWVYWGVNLIALVTIGLWILWDGKFSEVAVGLERALTSDLQVPYSPLLATQVHVLQGILLVGLVSGLGIVAILLAGFQSHRSIRGWLAAMAVCAVWLSLIVGWPELVWQGRGWRVGRAIGTGWLRSNAAVDQFAQSLMADWPTKDGDLPVLGFFTAYPVGKPTTLMLIRAAQFPNSTLSFNSVERGRGNDLHFQLTGNEAGVWLVRSDDAPKAFFSGLSGEYRPLRYLTVGSGWYLVEYAFSPLVGVPEPVPAR